MELENEADGLAAVEREPLLGRVREVDAAVTEFAGGRDIEATELVEVRSLARAGRAEEHDELASSQIEVDAGQRADLRGAFAVDLGASANAEDGFGLKARAGDDMRRPACAMGEAKSKLCVRSTDAYPTVGSVGRPGRSRDRA